MQALLRVARVLGTTSLLQLRRAKYRAWEQYISPHFTTRIVQTLFNIGLMDELARGPVDVIAFAQRNGYDEGTLVALCEALHARKVLIRQSATTFRLDEPGQFMVNEPMARGWFELTYGYENVLYNLENIVRKKVAYGANGFVRDGRYVATGSGFASLRFYFPYVVEKLKSAGHRKVLDIGCGDGTFLKLLREADPRIEGVGVDLSPEGVAQGNLQLKQAGLADKIKLHVGDAAKLREVEKHLKGVDGAATFFVLHELCDQMENPRLVAFLKQFREVLPGVPFHIVETIRPTADEMRQKPGPAIEYFLFHDLSNQKPVDRVTWKKLFEKAGFQSIEEDYLDFARTAIFTIK